MKKMMTNTAALLLVFGMLLTLISCSTALHGTYTSKDGLIEQSFTFKDDNKVDVSAFGLHVEGDYSIKDGKITITYSLMGLSYDLVQDFEKKGNSILIDGTEFVKEK